MKAVIVTNIPRPYRHALFNEMADQLGGSGSLVVVFTSDPEKHARRRQAAHHFASARYGVCHLRGIDVPLGEAYVGHLAWRLPALLRQLRPDVVAVGGFGTDALLVQATCRLLGCPSVLWSGAWVGAGDDMRRLRNWERKWVVREACAAVTYGTLAREYLAQLGMPARNIRVATNTVDLEAFAATAARAREERAVLAQRFQLADKNLLFLGGLLRGKGVRELMAAFDAMSMNASECTLHMVGAGPEWAELNRRASRLQPGKRVVFHGFLQPREVARLAGLCDVFVFPSLHELHERWGLVVNEAMACGLPVVASCHAGASRDLVHDGLNGFLVDPANSAEMAARMSDLLGDEGRRATMAQAALDTVRERASLAGAATAFLEAMALARVVHDARR